MKRRGPVGTPNYLFLLGIPAALFNLLFPIYEFIIEGWIIGGPLPFGSRLDHWTVERILGTYTSANFQALLFGFYLAACMAGLLIGYALLAPVFKRLRSTGEVSWSEINLGMRMVADLVGGALFFTYGFQPVLVYLSGYSSTLFAGYSEFGVYALTGFITGSFIGKAIHPIRLYFMLRRAGLRLQAGYTQAKTNGSSRGRMMLRWTLTKINP